MSELSPGVQIIIDQLAHNPDEFFGPVGSSISYPKFNELRKELTTLACGPVSREEFHPPLWYLTQEEKDALIDAFTQARRLRFDAEVVFKLHNDDENKKLDKVYYTGNSMPKQRLQGNSLVEQARGAMESMVYSTAPNTLGDAVVSTLAYDEYNGRVTIANTSK